MKKAPPGKSGAIFRLGLGLALAVSACQPAGALAQSAAKKSEEVWKAPAEATRTQNPVRADENSVGRGKELYGQECLPCHGPTGKGDGPNAGTLERHHGDLSA